MHDDQIRYFEKEFLDCSDTEELVNYYLDGEMLPGLTGRFHRHLNSCESCVQLLEDCRILLDAAKSLASTPMPQSAKARLRNALNEKLGENFQVEKQSFTLVKGRFKQGQ